MPTAAGAALLDRFDRVRIVNLPARADRRREMTGQLARLGLAVDGTRIAFHEACRPADAGAFPTIGARGCFLSHLGVLRDALAGGAANVLLLEDDLNFARDAEAAMPRAFAALGAQPWSIFYGGHEVAGGPPAAPGPIAEVAAETIVGMGHFVAFARPALACAVPYLEAMLARAPGDPAGGPMHVDGAYTWLRGAFPELRTWLALPELGYQRASRTDIHVRGFVDETPGLRQLASVARRLRNRLR